MKLFFQLLLLSIFLVISGWWLNRNIQLVKTGVEVDGIILSVEPRAKKNKKPSYHPVVQYTLENGEQNVLELSEGSGPTAYAVGDTLSLLYQRATPQDLTINNSFRLYVIPSIFIGIMLLGIVTAIGQAVKKTGS